MSCHPTIPLQPKQRGFTGTRPTDNGYGLSPIDFQTDPLQDRERIGFQADPMDLDPTPEQELDKQTGTRLRKSATRRTGTRSMTVFLPQDDSLGY